MIKYPKKPILIIDDEKEFLYSVELVLSSNLINNVKLCDDSRKVQSKLENDSFSLILLDLNMPYKSGFELLPELIEQYPEIPIIIITASNDVDSAVTCMKIGAFDFVVKPVDETRLLTIVKRGIDMREIKNENLRLKESLFNKELKHPEIFSKIITKSKTIKSIFQYIEAIADTKLPLLITGETGAGKELFAEAVHKASGRKGNFVIVNVAGVDDTLFSDTLFGHKKGAFTGADKDRKGMIEEARSGSLFLDEIGDLSLESQVKLLRLLQDGRFYPLGSDIAKLTDTRIIVATNKDIQKMQVDNSFRKDLFYRLKSHNVHIPPLRERRGDIQLLVDHFLNKYSKELNKKRLTPPKELYKILKNYFFPGNVRELEGIIADIVSRHTSGILSIKSLKNLISAEGELEKEMIVSGKFSFPEILPSFKEMEKKLIETALKRADGNQSIAAQMLGISRRALNNRIQRRKDN